jgi:hypothetical protein
MASKNYILFLLLISMLLAGCTLIPTPPWTTTEPPVNPTEPLPTDTPADPTVPPATETLPAYPIETSPAPLPTSTATTEETQTPLDETLSPTEQPEFILQPGSPFYLPNFNHPEAGCSWLGIAGQVFDLDGTEIQGLVIRSGEFTAVTGDAIAYGPGGFEIQIGEAPVGSNGVFDLQVFDKSGQSLSERIFITTYEDCDQNLILVNFVRADEDDFPTATPTLEAYP